MASNRKFGRSSFGRDSLPLDAARTAFEWLVTGPHPVSIEGWRFPRLPRRQVPLDELRDLLLDGSLPMSTVDPVWVHLVTRSRDEGGTWTVACVGIALPALFAIAAELCAPFADDHRDVHGAILTGFLSELASIDLAKPWVMWRLRCAGLRAGHLFIRDALDRPMPSDEDFHSSEPAPPWGHPDFVLARAVADGAITGDEAELIGSTRLEDYTLTAAAADRGVKVTALHWVRSQAEARLLAWLTEQSPHDDPADRRERDVEIRAVNATAITAAATAAFRARRQPTRASRTVAGSAYKPSVTVRHRAWKKPLESGVEGCGRRAVVPSHTTSPDCPAESTRRSSSATPEEPRCA
ncbi:hypothetical protein [Saccharothrix texasensis]|uniref:Uncharacterized protein n=1 Tax=Saccharothrix texasensis TaxID=103734 RepID=A0A3N1H496_9PSEU|nr:hypothetical protein [Saccharothrix texasensis]ROP37335.1 hypothetical protein EDD40_2640 [Saccharothrix texasensis]